MMETSVLVTSKSSLLRSDVGASEPAIIDGSYKILTSMDIPTSLGEKSMASSQPCGVAQQNKKFECGYLLSEALNTNDSSQSLGSDSGDKTCKKNVLMRKVHQGLERINNTVDSGQQINQESSSSDEKHKGKLYENQRRFWKKEILDAGGDSNASNKAHKVKKKTRRKRLRKREARREVERNGASAFPVGEDVRKKMWDRGLKKRGYLEDQDAVTQRGGDDEKYSSTLLGFLKNYAGSPVNNPNSGKGRKTTVQDAERLTNDGIQMYSSTMKTENNLMPEALINKEPVDLKQDDGHKQEDLKGNHIKNTERLCKGSNQQSKHNEAGILLGVKKQIEEEGGFGQILGNEQTQVQDAVDNNVVSLAERKANEDAASSGSALQQRIKNQSQMKPGSAQSNRSLPETNPLASSDVEGRSSMNGLNSIQEHTRFPVNRTVVLGSSKITGESVSSQKPNVLKDEQNPQEPSEVFKSCRNTKDQGIEDIQILAASNFWSPGDLGCTSDPSWEHQVPTHCNQTTGDSYAGIKLATCRREDAVYGNNQLLDKLESENKGEKAMLADCMQNQWTVDTLRKQVVDVIAMLKVCQSVGELILRNTGLTDDLLEMLVSALANNSQSEVETINLNINNLGWQSAELLVKLLKVKPSIKCLLLHGNNLGDKGICILMNGLIDLFLMENTEETRNEIQGGEQVVIQKKKLQLTELDIGSNQLTNEGLKCVTSLLSLNPPLQYLGLSQNNAIDLTGWRQLFDNLKNCRHISHVLLDENVLCNEGAKYLADVLCVNGSLRKVDLDSNEIEDEGGLALCEALCSNPHRSLRYLSLHGNKLSNGVKNKLNILLTENNQGYVKP